MQTKITPELAEFLGIMVGDGNIYISKDGRRHRFIISGHLKNDNVYLNYHVKWLIENLFENKFGKISGWRFKKKKSFAISVTSKEIITQLISLGLKVGKKSQTVTVPTVIIRNKNKKIKAAFLRGIADTDFSMVFHKGSSRVEHTYPIITGVTSSQKLAYQIKRLLKEFKIKANIGLRPPGGFSKVTQYVVYIYGKENLEKWLKYIGFSNPNHTTKVEVWKKFGFYLPNTSINERLILSKGIKLLPRYATASSLLADKGRLDRFKSGRMA